MNSAYEQIQKGFRRHLLSAKNQMGIQVKVYVHLNALTNQVWYSAVAKNPCTKKKQEMFPPTSHFIHIINYLVESGYIFQGGS